MRHARLPCPSPTPRACSNSCPLSQWGHTTISSSVIPFSTCLQSFPASGSFPMGQFFTSGGQSIGSSASASVLLMNIQDWFPFFSFSDFFHSSLSWDIEYSSLCYIVGPCLCIILIRVYWYQVHPKLPIHPSLPPSIFLSIRVFSCELVLPIRWPKYWSFSFSISPSNEYSGLISFTIDWLDLLAVQGTLKSLLQHHSSKASILWCLL